MIGSLGDDTCRGEIPADHRLQTPSEAVPITQAFNLRVRDSGLKTQNYDKGSDRFVRKFDPEVEMSATMAVYSGRYSDHGWAVYVTQKKLRRRTPGFIMPSELQAQRRTSIDLGGKGEPLAKKLTKTQEAPTGVASTQGTRTKKEVKGDIPPHLRAYVTFQDQNQPEREWKGWYTEEDTEESIARRAQSALRILGNWRRLSYWRDHEGIKIVLTNRRKEVGLRYSLDDEPEIKEVVIYEDDTPGSVMSRPGKRDNYYVVDMNDKPFDRTDSLFGYATLKGAQPVRVKHRAKMSTMKTPRKDNREKVEVRFGDEKLEFERGVYKTHQWLVDEARSGNHLSESWKIVVVRAEEERIIVECSDGTDPFWFSEKTCPPLDPKGDKLRDAVALVPPGGWGKVSTATQAPMQTRAQAKAAVAKEFKVILQLSPSGERFDIGTVKAYDQALDFVRNACGLTNTWELSIVKSTQEEITVACEKGSITLTGDLLPMQVSPVQKSLPAKLVGDGSWWRKRVFLQYSSQTQQLKWSQGESDNCMRRMSLRIADRGHESRQSNQWKSRCWLQGKMQEKSKQEPMRSLRRFREAHSWVKMFLEKTSLS
jgi:hypothetical protein